MDASYSARNAASLAGSLVPSISTSLISGPTDCSVAVRKCCGLSAGLSINPFSKVRSLTASPSRSRIIGRSPHCTGCNDRGWRADFDFLLQPASLIRTLEGRYEGRQSVAAPVYRNGALTLLMADARTGETPEQAHARQMAEIDARAAGALIDHDPDDCGLFELPTGGEPLVRPPLIGNGLAAEAAHSAQRSAGPEHRSNGPRSIGDILGHAHGD